MTLLSELFCPKDVVQTGSAAHLAIVEEPIRGIIEVVPPLEEQLRCSSNGGAGSCHKRQKPQAPTPKAPIRNRQTRKVANAKGLNRNTKLA